MTLASFPRLLDFLSCCPSQHSRRRSNAGRSSLSPAIVGDYTVMSAPKSQHNWLAIWSRKSRLRSGTCYLASVLGPGPQEALANAKAEPWLADMGPQPRKAGLLDRGSKSSGNSRNGSKRAKIASDNGLGALGNRVEEETRICDDAIVDDAECMHFLDPLEVVRKILFESKNPGNGSKKDPPGGSMEANADDEHKPVVEKYDVDTSVDAEYGRFLEHLKVDSMSYYLEFVVDGSPLILRYEDGVHSSDVFRADPTRSNAAVFGGGAAENGSKKNASLCREFGSNASPERLHCGPKKMGDRPVDEDYRLFLTYLREHDELMVFESDENVIRYEMESEDEDPNDDDELQACASSPQPSNANRNFEDDDGSSCSLCEILPYKDRLNNFLERPFDQDEYDDLLKRATLRLPISKYKHLRSQTISYVTKKLGMSFFDHYPGLAERISCADSSMGLKLLRGLFFWLQNMSHEGSFKPWEHGGILADPGSESVDSRHPILIDAL